MKNKNEILELVYDTIFSNVNNTQFTDIITFDETIDYNDDKIEFSTPGKRFQLTVKEI